MATSSKLNLTRDQLASFLQDHEQIKQFERLFASVNELVPTTIADLIINTGNADQKAVQALDALKRIADALELLATAPTATPQRGAQDDLTPPAERRNSIDYVDFNPLTPVPANVTGRVHWNGGTTLGVQMTPNVLQRVGETEFVYVKASSAITKGQLCYHTGAVGSSGVITAAPTPISLADPNEIVGVAAESIALNGFGLIQISGDLRGFDTTGSSVGEVWADGDALYYNPAFVGSMTKVKPSAPNQKSYIGEVINAGSGGSGSMHIRIVPGSVLGGTDSNVQITGVANNDVLVYDSVDQRWENYAPTAARDALGLGTGNPSNGQMLIGNGTDFTTAALTAGTGIAVTNGAGSATIATNLSAGAGISLSGTSPQIIATNLAAGANISITGTTPQTIAVTGLGSMAFQSTGATGSFLSANTPAKTVTVTNGIITSIV